MPAGAINKKERCWRSKKGKYLFSHTALAKVFRAKMLEGIRQAELGIPHCKIIFKPYQPKQRPAFNCVCCGDEMIVVRTRIKVSRQQEPDQASGPPTVADREATM